MQFVRWVAALALVAGCGKGKQSQAEHGAGSGSGPTTAMGAGSGAPAAASDWKLVAIRSGYAIVASGDHDAAIVAADGKVVGHVRVDDLADLQASLVAKDVLLWADDAAVHAWDLAKGAERWHTSLAGITQLVVAVDDVAVLHAKGTDLLALADGKSGFHREGAAGADGKTADHMFVLADAMGGVEAIEDASTSAKWSVKSNIKSPKVAIEGAHALVFDGGRTKHDDGKVTFENGSFVVLDLAHGKAVAHGDVDDTLPGKLAPGSQTSVAYAPDGGTFVVAKPEKGPLTMFRRDPVGRVKWSAKDWPLEGTLYEDSSTVLLESGNVGGLLLKPRRADGTAHVAVVFDAKTGKLHFKRDLGTHGELVKVMEACSVLLDVEHGNLACLDNKTAKPTWTRPVAGRESRAWSAKDSDDVFLISGDPSALERIDASGQTRWRLDVAATLPTPRDIGSGMIVVGGGPVLSVIDLSNGKLSKVRP